MGGGLLLTIFGLIIILEKPERALTAPTSSRTDSIAEGNSSAEIMDAVATDMVNSFRFQVESFKGKVRCIGD